MFFNNSFWKTKNIIFLLLVIVLLFIFPKIVGILLLFFAAYIIACALNPYVNKLSAKMNRSLAATIVLSSTLVSILALIIPIFIVAFNEIRILAITFPDKITKLVSIISNGKIYGHKLIDILDFNTILGGSTAFAKGILSQSVNITISLVQLAVILITMTMIVYYIIADKDYLKKKLLQFFPPDLKNKANDILSTISFKVGYYVRAQLISMAAVAIMVMIVLAALKVDYATLLGLISGILDIIPILGPTIALIIILLFASPAAFIKVLLIIGGFLLCQQLSNYVIKPILFGKLMQMHPLTIFLALFLANQFIGFWGVILSPAVAATVCVLVDELYLKPINNKATKGIDIEK